MTGNWNRPEWVDVCFSSLFVVQLKVKQCAILIPAAHPLSWVRGWNVRLHVGKGAKIFRREKEQKNDFFFGSKFLCRHRDRKTAFWLGVVCGGSGSAINTDFSAPQGGGFRPNALVARVQPPWLIPCASLFAGHAPGQAAAMTENIIFFMCGTWISCVDSRNSCKNTQIISW